RAGEVERVRGVFEQRVEAGRGGAEAAEDVGTPAAVRVGSAAGVGARRGVGGDHSWSRLAGGGRADRRGGRLHGDGVHAVILELAAPNDGRDEPLTDDVAVVVEADEAGDAVDAGG